MSIGEFNREAQAFMKGKFGIGRTGLNFKHTVAHTIDCETARYFTGKRAAHAIADGKQ